MAAGSLPTPDPSLGGISGSRDGTGLRVGLVAARWNIEITGHMVGGARRACADLGVAEADLTVAWAPGSFELPVVAAAMARSGRHDAVIAIGAVVRGETTHYDLVSEGAAEGLLRVGIDTGVPVIFGVIATETEEQAVARSGGPDGSDDSINKGYEAVLTAVETATLLRALQH